MAGDHSFSWQRTDFSAAPASSTSMLPTTPFALLLVASLAAANVLHTVQLRVLSDDADADADAKRTPVASRAYRHNEHVAPLDDPKMQLTTEYHLRQDVEAGFVRRYPTNAKLVPVQLVVEH